MDSDQAAPAIARGGHRPAYLVPALIAAGLLTVVVILWSIAEAGNTLLSKPEAVLLGIVEGLTEFLPISSTGHLTVTEKLLGLTDTTAAKRAADAYAIAIQAGAILAVLGLYRTRIWSAVRGVFGRGPSPAEGRNLVLVTLVAFLPAALAGFVLGDSIEEHLFGLWPVIGAWFVGGLVILAWPKDAGRTGRALERITMRDGVIIGLAQTLALWPGVSRSLVVILACLAIGLNIAASVEFAFLLGLVTLGAATVYSSLRKGGEIVDQFGVASPVIGFVAAFLSAAAAVVWMVAFVQRKGMRPFGWYRIGVAALVAVLALTVL